MSRRVLAAAIVFLGLLSAFLMALEIRGALADLLEGRHDNVLGPLLLFLLVAGALVAPHLAWAGPIVLNLGGALVLLLLFDDAPQSALPYLALLLIVVCNGLGWALANAQAED